MQDTFLTMSRQCLEAKKGVVKPATLAVYTHFVHHHLLPEFGERTRITEQDARQFIQKKMEAGLSAKTVKDMMIVLKMIVRYGAQKGVWAEPDWALHYPLSKRGSTPAVFQEKDYYKLSEYLWQHPSPRNLGILLSLTTGLRIGEVCALQWKDVHLRQGFISINKTLERVGPALQMGSPKTVNSIRDIPITCRLHELLTRLQLPPETFLLSGGPKPLEPRTFRYYYARLLEQLGIAYIKYHGLRHSFATRCIAHQCDPKTVSVLLGHSNVNTTLNLYVHPGLEQQRACLELMETATAQSKPD